MSQRTTIKHFTQTAQPQKNIQEGDEWFNPSNNRLYKYMIRSGTQLGWIEIPNAVSSTIYNGPTQELFYVLPSGWTGRDGTGSQGIFGLGVDGLGTGVTVAADNIYIFEINATLIKTAGVTSHTLSTAFGGTAGINFIYYQALENDSNGGMNTRFSTIGVISVNTAAATVVTGSMGAATQYVSLLIKGTVSFRTSGTFVPRYVLSAAPGGAYTTQPGSYMTLTSVPSNIGTWA